MTRTSLKKPLRRAVLVACTVALAGTIGLAAPSLPAHGATQGTATQSAEPVYPSASPSSEEEDEGTILIPSVTSQEGKMYLAVTDTAIDDVDSQKIMDAVREAVDGQNAKILLGVDKKPNNLKGASQLVRGMLMFGDSDAMSDDWLENGKTKGYVGEGWIAVGVMLPESPGGEVEVFVDPGRNVKETETGSKDKILDAGTQHFEAGDYTAGVSAVAISTTENLRAPLDKKIALGIVFGVLLLIAAVLAFFGLRQKRRNAVHAAAKKRLKQAEGWDALIQQDLNALCRTPATAVDARVSNRSTRTLKEIQVQRETALGANGSVAAGIQDAIVEGKISEKQAQQLAGQAEHLALLRRAVELARGLNGTAGNSVKSWNQIIEQHRGGLQLLVQMMDREGAARLQVAPQIRTAIVTHTDALDQMHQRARGKAGPGESAQLLEDLWELRDELDSLIDLALSQAKAAQVKVDAKLVEQLLDFLPRAGAKANDPISVLRVFAPVGGQK
ncbi:hypothetical protein OF385_13825 [Glutamicibacter sp. JL.03c]|uniref:hypothetical protein n=1 Tax=Glutamicibacter sp. JL.03c TaxID=2984842 RepID=UPI0021F75329|nr:hypothetical protein [Glutamicibacter sp. JL.03c]UYQ77084.1 hypothetical protein OF385_13825 [Glutamicibacter sp. JL.03c]